MSTAHRPTWTPAQGKSDTRHASKITSVRDLPGQTKLKYRQDEQQVAGGSRESMKAQLDRAERDARNKKRKAMGLEPEEESEDEEQGDDAEGEFKKPRLIRGDDDEDDEEEDSRLDKGKGVAQGDEDGDDDDDDADDSDIEARARAILKEQRGDASER